MQATFVILHFLVATWRKVKDASDIYFIYPNIAKIVSVYHLINVKHYGDILLFFVVVFFGPTKPSESCVPFTHLSPDVLPFQGPRCGETGPERTWQLRCRLASGLQGWHILLSLSSTPADTLVKFSGGYFRRTMSHSMGVLHPSFNLSQILREQMERYLPANIHQLISGRVFISLTRVSDWGNVLVSEFQSKDEVLDVSGLSVRACRQIGKAVSFWQ